MLSTNELFPWWDQKPFCHLILIHLVKNFWQSKDILIYHVHSFLWKVKLFLSSFSWGWGNFYSLTLHEWWSSSEFSSCKSLFTYLWLISLPSILWCERNWLLCFYQLAFLVGLNLDFNFFPMVGASTILILFMKLGTPFDSSSHSLKIQGSTSASTQLLSIGWRINRSFPFYKIKFSF